MLYAELALVILGITSATLSIISASMTISSLSEKHVAHVSPATVPLVCSRPATIPKPARKSKATIRHRRASVKRDAGGYRGSRGYNWFSGQ
jgi:hypothetical protein